MSRLLLDLRSRFRFLENPLAIFATLTFLGACGAPAQDELQVESGTQVRNGVPISASNPDKHPAVVPIVSLYAKFLGMPHANSGFCSATFISQNTILTAAHCVKHPAFGSALNAHIPGFPSVTVKEFLVHPDYAEEAPRSFWNLFRNLAVINSYVSRFDIALVKYGGRAPATQELAPAPALAGNAFTMVGFGGDRWIPNPDPKLIGPAHYLVSGTGTKRTGQGKIGEIVGSVYFGKGKTTAPTGRETVDKNKVKSCNGKPVPTAQRLPKELPFACFGEPTGQDTSLAPGDSGSPMLISAKIHGVGSVADPETGHYRYAPADLKTMSKFYEQARARGFDLGIRTIK